MSASLVGSEMCIRDRASRWRSAPLLTAESLGKVVGPPPLGPMTSSGAVSYTHLTLPTRCSV
eukprot:10154183-Alexandrium_andersonii.AAC.1